MTEEEYNIKADELLKDVPEEYREGCKSLAYENGHAYGYNEVYNHLDDIVYRIFKNNK